jgi:glycosidase
VQGAGFPTRPFFDEVFRMVRNWLMATVATALAASAPVAAQSPGYSADTVRTRAPQDEIIYFVLPDRFANGDTSNDRGGLKGDRLKTGFDPVHKGFFHGGDLAGLTAKLDYIQGLGVTAIWFAPIFQNKPVQGEPGQESAGYHGYWVTDFTRVDSHFGTNDAFKAFVDAAHARGIKVYMDIITNHTADVIYFQECAGQPTCAYRSKADYPYWTKRRPEGRSDQWRLRRRHGSHGRELHAADRPDLRLYTAGAQWRGADQGPGLAQ